jgi:WD40 repeat protein
VVGKKGTRNYISAICFEVIYGDSRTAVVMDTTTRMEVDRIEIGSFIWHLTVADGGEFLLVACMDNTGRVVAMKTKKTITLNGHTGAVCCIIELRTQMCLHAHMTVDGIS